MHTVASFRPLRFSFTVANDFPLGISVFSHSGSLCLQDLSDLAKTTVAISIERAGEGWNVKAVATKTDGSNLADAAPFVPQICGNGA
jgi:hypothetical protein